MNFWVLTVFLLISSIHAEERSGGATNPSTDPADSATCGTGTSGSFPTSGCPTCLETLVCDGKDFRTIERSFSPTMEISNWASAEIAASLFRILAEDVLNYQVNGVFRGDYLKPYPRVASGNTTIMFETWDEQMRDAKRTYTIDDPLVLNEYLGTTGVESIYIPAYIDQSKLTAGKTHYSFLNLQRLDTDFAATPFRRAGSTSCNDIGIITSNPACPVSDFDCENLLYMGDDPQCSADIYDFPCSRFGSPWEITECTHPEKSMWCPTHCANDPSSCLEVMMVTPAWAPGWFESIAQELGIPFCFVYFGSNFHALLGQRYEAGELFLNFWYYPDALTVKYPAIVMDFPTYSEECASTDKRDPITSGVNCAFAAQTLGKLLHAEIYEKSLESSNPNARDYSDLYLLWKNLQISRQTYDYMLEQHTSAGGNLTTSEAACTWLNTEEGKGLACDWLSMTDPYQDPPSPAASLDKWERKKVDSFISLVIISMLVVFIPVFFWFLYANQDHPIVKATSIPFMMYMLCGSTFVLFAAAVLLMPVNKTVCIINAWLYHLGFSILFISLAVKSYRIARIFRQDKISVQNLTNTRLSTYLIGAVCLIFTYLTISTIADFPEPKEVVENDSRRSVCWETAPVSIIILNCLEVLLLVGLTVISVRLRNAPAAYNEAKAIGKTVLAITLISLLLTPLHLFDLGQTPTTRHLCAFISQTGIVLIVMALFFLQKLYQRYWHSDAEHIRLSASKHAYTLNDLKLIGARTSDIAEIETCHETGTITFKVDPGSQTDVTIIEREETQSWMHHRHSLTPECSMMSQTMVSAVSSEDTGKPSSHASVKKSPPTPSQPKLFSISEKSLNKEDDDTFLPKASVFTTLVPAFTPDVNTSSGLQNSIEPANAGEKQSNEKDSEEIIELGTEEGDVIIEADTLEKVKETQNETVQIQEWTSLDDSDDEKNSDKIIEPIVGTEEGDVIIEADTLEKVKETQNETVQIQEWTSLDDSDNEKELGPDAKSPYIVEVAYGETPIDSVVSDLQSGDKQIEKADEIPEKRRSSRFLQQASSESTENYEIHVNSPLSSLVIE